MLGFELPSLAVVFANRAAVRILGVPAEHIPSRLDEDDRAQLGLTVDPQNDGWLARVLDAQDGQVIEHEYEARSRLGEPRWFDCHDIVFARNADGRPTQALRVINNVTARHLLERELVLLANTDALTGLWNRRHLLDLARAEIGRARRHGHELAMIAADIDGLKALNDERGHSAGDAALKHFADVACASARDYDAVARFGGDEFVLLLPETDLAGATELARRILEAAQQGPSPVSCCMGIARLGGGDDTLEELLARADTALYQAKAAGTGQIRSA